MVKEIKALCKENGITVQWLSLHFGWGANSINRWDDNRPSVDKVLCVADYFGVSMDYLCNRTGYELSADNFSLIKKYRDLDDHGKNSVLYTINNEYERMRQIEEIRSSRPKLKVLPRSIQPASAGTGVLLDSESMENIIVVETSKTKQASFIVRVSGNSMEPEYHDGDQLLVDATQEPPIGKIGVFIIDGSGYVKKRGETSLISLNKDYADIPYNDSIRCSGLVIGILDPKSVY